MDRLEFKLLDFRATESADEPAGLFAARVSVFGSKDRVGDRVMFGAFKKTIGDWIEKKAAIPVVWSHGHLDPENYIGEVDPADMRETKDGLIVAGKIDVAQPKARRVFELLKKGLVNNWSFAYQPTKVKMAKDGAREISELDLFEVGPTLVGAHGGTKTLALKALDLDTDLEALLAEAEAEVEEKAVDDSPWDGNRAMGMCSSASDYRSICAGEHNAGEPDQRQHWALPHHYLGRGPNAAGVRNAMSRLPQTQDLKNAGAARSHLEAHMSSVSGSSTDPERKLDELVADEFANFEAEVDAAIEQKIGRVISTRTASRIRTALNELTSLLVEAGVEEEHTASVESEEPESTTEGTETTSETDSEETVPDERTLIRASLAHVDTYLLERDRS